MSYDDPYHATPNSSSSDLLTMMNRVVEPLAQLCENYIVKHLEEFPVSRLSLLPLSMRRDLLWRLPIADVCLRLENTDFVKGLDMAAYWKLPCEKIDPFLAFPKDSDIEQYIKERWSSEVEYAKARLYGQIATCRIGGLPSDDYQFVLPQNGYVDIYDDTTLFLYGVRELHGDEGDCLTVPSRYQQMSNLQQREEDDNGGILDTIMHCFNSKRPKMLPEIQLYHEDVMFNTINLSDAELHFLSEVEYVGMQCRPFLYPRGVDFITALVNVATNLQVLILQGLNVPDDPLDLDYFCEQLATCQPFWSKFRILKIVAGIPVLYVLEGFGVDSPEEYTVSQSSLDQLITAYLSAPTDHSQLVQFSFTNIKQQDAGGSPAIDRTYLQFKNIRLSDCRFTCKATPDAISKWLGQEIKMQERQEETSSFLFQIDHKDGSVLGHKR